MTAAAVTTSPVVLRRVKTLIRTGLILVVVVALIHRENVHGTRKLFRQGGEELLRTTSSTLAIAKAVNDKRQTTLALAPVHVPAVVSRLTDHTSISTTPISISVPFIEQSQRGKVGEAKVQEERSQSQPGHMKQVSVPYIEKAQRGAAAAGTTKNSPQERRQNRPRRMMNKKDKDTEAISVRNAEKTNLPPINALIGDLHENVTGNVQSLLDFAIVGFGKCGTTALIDWLDGHPEINTIPKEALHLSRQRPALMVQKLYQMKVDSLLLQNTYNSSSGIGDIQNNDDYQQQQSDGVAIAGSNNTNSNKDTKDIIVGRIQGFKNPSDIRRPEAMTYLTQHWPETKLIITVRHPVFWFKSLYNFLVNEMGRTEKYLHHTSLIGGPHKNTAYAHTGKGEFHAILSLLGKTPMDTDEELELLQGFLRDDEILKWPKRMPNKIFFLDTAQMSDTNETRAAILRHDLQDFLGLEQALPPVLHVRPGKDRKVDESLKIDMCKPENDEIRHELLRISKKASLWFRNFFMNSEDVIVSSREYLDEIFATTWMQDPCNDIKS